ncbi:MAG TPA: NTP transferase domain-containing protein [Steroidobacteraceae bacterium]
MSAPLYGLVLAGGRSTRMQRDKAVLDYAGRSQLSRAMELLAPLVERSFVSVRIDQVHDPSRAAFACIADVLPGLGPIGGIHAALRAHPEAAWLVLACDLPFLDSATLQQLIAARAPEKLATAFRSRFNGQPEPLCAIYEPASRPAIDRWIAGGEQCPRGFLAQADVRLLDARAARALDNINTSEEYLEARGALLGGGSAAATPQALTVQYFALLRDQAGRREERLDTASRTPRELYEELRIRHSFGLRAEQLRVAINDEFGEWTQPLKSGDVIAFLPPVAGG